MDKAHDLSPAMRLKINEAIRIDFETHPRFSDGRGSYHERDAYERERRKFWSSPEGLSQLDGYLLEHVAQNYITPNDALLNQPITVLEVGGEYRVSGIGAPELFLKLKSRGARKINDPKQFRFTIPVKTIDSLPDYNPIKARFKSPPESHRGR